MYRPQIGDNHTQKKFKQTNKNAKVGCDSLKFSQERLGKKGSNFHDSFTI
jgi:hypothetical protein